MSHRATTRAASDDSDEPLDLLRAVAPNLLGVTFVGLCLVEGGLLALELDAEATAVTTSMVTALVARAAIGTADFAVTFGALVVVLAVADRIDGDGPLPPDWRVFGAFVVGLSILAWTVAGGQLLWPAFVTGLAVTRVLVVRAPGWFGRFLWTSFETLRRVSLGRGPTGRVAPMGSIAVVFGLWLVATGADGLRLFVLLAIAVGAVVALAGSFGTETDDGRNDPTLADAIVPGGDGPLADAVVIAVLLLFAMPLFSALRLVAPAGPLFEQASATVFCCALAAAADRRFDAAGRERAMTWLVGWVVLAGAASSLLFDASTFDLGPAVAMSRWVVYLLAIVPAMQYVVETRAKRVSAAERR
ncbi:hypothetical protein [Haloarchaeobius sp. DFWS5]|uniref:hypothetical protein n=1 Tax=Haloarchaeobius sp. DFWS5 TaxID=3446114 RepID=UPI003EBA4312